MKLTEQEQTADDQLFVINSMANTIAAIEARAQNMEIEVCALHNEALIMGRKRALWQEKSRISLFDLLLTTTHRRFIKFLEQLE